MTNFPTFEEFFSAIDEHRNESTPGRSTDWVRRPYRWQRMLAAEVQSSNWPERIEVPTGLGKTSCIQIAVYELARQLFTAEPRTAPLRIFHVIDRNSVVQQSSDDVHLLAAAVNHGTSPALCAVREALETALPLGQEPGPAVSHATYRGTYRDGDPLRAFGCMITTMTAHQFISQLLFRGFGVTPKSRPIYAGLAGIDSLVLFDEPHLSLPSLTALQDVRSLQSQTAPQILMPLRVVTLGATQQATGQDANADTNEPLRTRLIEAVFDDDQTQAVRDGQRSILVSTITSKSDSAFAKRIAGLAAEVHRIAPERRIGIIVNTLAVAHQVANQLRKTGHQIEVVTSRVRPVDRQLPHRGQPRASLEATHPIVVATQCIEVGVDITFDHLITEACPLPTFIQRIGRLNRHGGSTGTGHLITATSQGGVAVRDGSAAVYGELPIARTVDFLQERGPDGKIDCSLVAQQNWPDPGIEVWPSPVRHATLTWATVPYLTLTNPPLASDLPISAFILGPDAEPTFEVQVAWRDNLDDLEDCPPLDAEYITLPIGTVRAFLRGDRRLTTALSDSSEVDKPAAATPHMSPLNARVRDRDGEWKHSISVQPGAAIVIATGEGGYSNDGWDPSSTTVVPDVAALAALTSPLHKEARFPLSAGPLRSLAAEGMLDHGDVEEILGILEDLDPDDPDERSALTDAVNRCLDRHDPESRHARLAEIVPTGPASIAALVAKVPQDRNASVVVQSLPEHLTQVRNWAEADASAIGLPEDLVCAISEAGLAHDFGKCSPAWQQMASKGRITAQAVQDGLIAPDGLTAKFLSSLPPNMRRSYKVRSAYPSHWRHEAMSFDFVSARGRIPLVNHLVAAHHGWFRPFAPLPAINRFPGLTVSERESQRHGARHADVFDQLNREFGPWGLAFLESVLRLADQRASEFPQAGVDAASGRALLTSSAVSQKAHTPSANAEIELIGLTTTPTTGWFAVAGLLGTAAQIGVAASVLWRPVPDAGGRPEVPVLQLDCSLPELVDELWRRDDLKAANELASQFLGHDLFRKSHKIASAARVGELLRAADGQPSVITGVVNDLAPADPSFELSATAIANNSSYGQVAERALKQPSSAGLAALLDEAAGYTITNCDGGFDRPRGVDPLVNGIGEHGARLSRSLLAPFVLAGFAALGTPPVGGHGVVGRTLTLPLPERFTTLADLRSLTLIGDLTGHDWSTIDTAWVLRGSLTNPSKYESLWTTEFERRS